MTQTSSRSMLLMPLSIVFFEIALYLSNDAFLPGIPAMMQELSLDTFEAQLTISLWFIGSAMTTLFIGILSDHLGRRPIITFGAITYTLASLLLVFITNKYCFLGVRLVQGAMVSFLTVAGYAAIHETYHHQATKILALMSSITIIAPALGPLLGGIILQFAHWRSIFLLLFILGAISIFLTMRFIPETLDAKSRQPLALKEGFLSYCRLLQTRQYVIYNVLLSLLFSGFIAWVTLSPLLLLENFSFSTISFGCIQVIIFSCYIIGSKVMKHYIDIYSRATLILTSLMIAFGTSLLGCLSAWLFPKSFILFLPCMMGYSFAAAISFPVLGRLAIEAATEPMGRRTGMQSTMLMVFASIGTSLAGWLYNGELLGLTRYILSAAACALVMYLILQLTHRKNNMEPAVTQPVSEMTAIN